MEPRASPFYDGDVAGAIALARAHNVPLLVALHGGDDASARLMRRLEMEEYSDDDDDGDDGGGGGTTRAGVGVGGDVAALRALKTALSKPLASDADVRRVLRGEKRAGYMKTTRALELRREARLGGGGRRERTKRDA